jgi:tetratricopeptide (TPR) repeat protein
MRKYSLVFVLLSILYLNSFCQDTEARKRDSLKIDSLKNALMQLTDRPAVDCMNSIAEKYIYFDQRSTYSMDSAFAYALKAKEEARRIHYKDGEAKSLLNLGDCEWVRRKDYDLGEKYIRGAIAVTDSDQNPIFVGNAYMRIAEVLNTKTRQDRTEGNMLILQSERSKIIEAYTNAAKYYQQGDNRMGEGSALTWLCMMHTQDGNYDEGFEFCEKGLRLTSHNPKEYWEFDALRWSLFNMSELYKAVEEYETALNYMRQCRQVAMANDLYDAMESEMGDLFNLTGQYDSALYYFSKFRSNPKRGEWLKGFYYGALAGMGYTYFMTKQYDSSLQILNECISYSREARFLILEGRVYTAMKNYPLALKSVREGVNNAEKAKVDIKTSPWLVDGYELLSESYHYFGKDHLAYQYLKKHTTFKDSAENRKSLWRLNHQLNNYKKQAEEERKTSQINLLNKDNQLKEQKLKQQATIRNSLIAVILLLFLLGVFVIRSFYLKRKKQQAESERKQTELEMQALRAQMNPHFIFNCLSSINKYILKNEPDTAADYLTRFSRLIRMVLVNSQKPLITLEDELEMLTIYLDMERLRFKSAFNYYIVFANRVDAGAVFIPPLLLQPFCENAIWHGLKHLADPQSGRREQGRLDIELSMDGRVLICTIIDNGIGREKAAEIRSKSAEGRKSMGLKITTDRLALLNREKGLPAVYEIEDLKDESGNATGTRVIFKICYKEPVEEMA